MYELHCLQWGEFSERCMNCMYNGVNFPRCIVHCLQWGESSWDGCGGQSVVILNF